MNGFRPELLDPHTRRQRPPFNGLCAADARDRPTIDALRPAPFGRSTACGAVNAARSRPRRWSTRQRSSLVLRHRPRSQGAGRPRRPMRLIADNITRRHARRLPGQSTPSSSGAGWRSKTRRRASATRSPWSRPTGNTTAIERCRGMRKPIASPRPFRTSASLRATILAPSSIMPLEAAKVYSAQQGGHASPRSFVDDPGRYPRRGASATSPRRAGPSATACTTGSAPTPSFLQRHPGRAQRHVP